MNVGFKLRGNSTDEHNRRKQRLMQAIGERVKIRRTELGWTRPQLANMCHVTRESIAHLEDGLAGGTMLIVDVADALGGTLDDIVPVDWDS